MQKFRRKDSQSRDYQTNNLSWRIYPYIFLIIVLIFGEIKIIYNHIYIYIYINLGYLSIIAFGSMEILIKLLSVGFNA